MRADGPQPPRHKMKPQALRRACGGGAALRRAALHLLRGGGGPAALCAGRGKGIGKDEDKQGRKDCQPEQADGDEAPFLIFCTAV